MRITDYFRSAEPNNVAVLAKLLARGAHCPADVGGNDARRERRERRRLQRRQRNEARAQRRAQNAGRDTA